MSIQFNDTSNLKGLVQLYEKEIGVNYGYISGNTERLKSFTADVNIAIDDFLDILIKNSLTWKPSSSNHTKLDEITTALVSGRRDYSFLTDENGNQILDVYRLYARTSATGEYKLLIPVDPDSQEDMDSFFNGSNLTGIPSRYDKQGNVFLLDLIPSYNSSDGLKASINREALYFTYTDTTRKSGFYGLYDSYFFLKPALVNSRRNKLANYSVVESEINKLENKISKGASRRTKDERPRLTIRNDNNK